MTDRIVYGLSADLPAFTGLSPVETGAALRAMGCAGVFLKAHDRAWVDGLHEAGLRVYGSQGVFIAHDDLWERMPESRPITASGEPAPEEEWYRPALPTSPTLRAHRLGQLEELASALPIDGVWLDFIRWPARWEKPRPQVYDSSFDPETLRRFQSDTGVRLPADRPTPQAATEWVATHAQAAWTDWRCRWIAAFVSEARTVLHRHRPQAKLGVFTVPWAGIEADRTGVTDAHLRIVGQDPALLGAAADVLSPMVYHRLCGREPAWAGEVTRRVRERSGCEVWPIVEAMPGDEAHSAVEFAQACRDASGGSTGSLMVFTAAGLLEDEAKVQAWRGLS